MSQDRKKAPEGASKTNHTQDSIKYAVLSRLTKNRRAAMISQLYVTPMKELCVKRLKSCDLSDIPSVSAAQEKDIGWERQKNVNVQQGN